MSEELKLLPCPACIGVAKFEYYKKDTEDCYVVCPLCEMRGPWKITKHEAITAWNSLPRALTWTTEPPSIEGLYFFRYVNDDGVPMGNVALIQVKSWCSDYHKNAQWAGPIPMPKEPKREKKLK